MKRFIRSFEETLKRRLAEPDPLIQVLIGPRQIGKTTAVRAILAEIGHYQTADSPTPLPAAEIEIWWKEAQQKKQILAIDEIQKIPGWSEVLKRLWDSKNEARRIVVTGSASLLVEKGLRESLAGRYELIHADHWNFREAAECFSMSTSEFIEWGCYPGAQRFASQRSRWSEYVRDSIVEPALGRDLLQLYPIDHPSLLRQIFGVAVSLPAQIISFQKLQGQLQDAGAIATIQNYLSLLEKAFLVTGLQKWNPEPFQIRRSSPKLIVHDNALIHAFERPLTALSPARLGRYFENAVGARLIEAGWDVFYWKDRRDEVDFVVFGPEGERLAIEVKSSWIENDDELHGLRLFTRRFPQFTPCLVSRVGQEVPGIQSIPVEQALSLCRR